MVDALINDEKLIAWAAGLFEGEGSLFVVTIRKPNKEYYYTRITVTSTDLDVLVKFSQVVQCGAIYNTSRSNVPKHHKQKFWWQNNNIRKTQEVIEAFWPYLCERRRNKAIELGCEPPYPN